ATAGRADEPAAEPCPAVSETACAPACCPCPETGCCHEGHPLLEWLLYRSERGACGCHKECGCCVPPLYVFFLSNCHCGVLPGHPALTAYATTPRSAVWHDEEFFPRGRGSA